jgi:hypothetical protein
VLKSDEGSIHLTLTSDVEPELFDFPLTLVTEVPENWGHCKVVQGNMVEIYPIASNKVMYNAIPNGGKIQLLPSAMDITPPGQVQVYDGAGQDIDSSPHTNSVSANWGPASDLESGISKYWYKIGTSPGGSEILDWIDNGRVRSFSTSRTNLALVRGEKYYVTIKAVNGVGLSSESTSDGFTVNAIPDYISFQEDFDSGYLSQWTKSQTRNGSDKNIIYLTERAARNGELGMQCHLQDLQSGTPFLSKDNVSWENEVFTRFYLKLSPDFHFTPESGNLQILELQDAGGNFVAQVSLGYKTDIGFHVYASAIDNTGYHVSIPGARGDYPLSYIPIKKEEWVRIDLRTIADEKKGGTELWVNGVREGCITNRFTDGLAVRNLRIGILNLYESSCSGDLFIDDISVSDSFLR